MTQEEASHQTQDLPSGALILDMQPAELGDTTICCFGPQSVVLGPSSLS